MSEAQLWPDEFKLGPAADPVHVNTDVVVIVRPGSYTGGIYHQQSLPWTPVALWPQRALGGDIEGTKCLN